MDRHLPALLAVVLVAAVASPAVGQPDGGTEPTVECAFPLEATDATGEPITLEEPPESVVALQPSDAQTVYEIGAADRLVGLPDEPATSGLEIGDRTDVTDDYRIVHERVIDLDPDLVLAANATARSDVDRLREAGLTVYQFDAARSLDDVRDNVATTGELTGECDGAAATLEWMDEQLATVEAALEGADRPLAYYAMGEDGTTAGTDTFVHEVLTTAGLENVAERAGIGWYEQLNPETVVDEDPEWIVYPNDRAEPPIPEAVEATTASREGNTLAVDANRMSQPAPQVVDAVVEIVAAVHPDAYERASADLEASADGNGTDDGDGTDEGSAIPGFGVAAAIGALLIAAGVAGRR
jgi:iron complex transport system substrate-binding protein